MTTPTPARPPLDPHLLAGAPEPWRVEVVGAAASTNLVVAERARSGARAGLVVVAEHQTAGRGRLDRAWTTPRGTALTGSVLLRPDGVPAGRWSWLPLLTGVALVDAVRRTTGLTVGLKWPNDLLVTGGEGGARERKLAGILVERVESPLGAAAVVGIGLNVAMSPAELPVAAATSLAAEGVTVGRERLLLALLDELADRFDRWRAAAGRPETLREDYRRRCVTVGREVTVDLPGGRSASGRAEAVDDEGRLVVATGEGRRAFGAGDVVHARVT